MQNDAVRIGLIHLQLRGWENVSNDQFSCEVGHKTSISFNLLFHQIRQVTYCRNSSNRTWLIRTSAYTEVRIWSRPRAIIKGWESMGFIEHGFIKFPAISSKQRHPRHPQSLFISNVRGHRPGQLVKCDNCHHYQAVNPRPATDSVISPRLALPSTSCCRCCICLHVLGKWLSKQMHQLGPCSNRYLSLLQMPNQVILSSATHRPSWRMGCSDCTQLMTLPLNGWRQQQQLVLALSYYFKAYSLFIQISLNSVFSFTIVPNSKLV